MNQSVDNDHSGGQEETRGRSLSCYVVNVTMVMTGYQGDDML